MANFSKVTVTEQSRVELHELLGLSGAEVSINQLPANASIPFVHAHKENEEIYFILAGKGYAVIDDEKVELNAGDCVKVVPEAKRQFFASEESAISYMCIQVKANSLENYTRTDAIIY